MWIASKYGFYSIVKKDLGLFHVRARFKKDLENLRRAARIHAKIWELKSADYQYRLLLRMPEFAKVMGALATSIDYSNFKDEVGSLADQSVKLPVYEDLWLNMWHASKGTLDNHTTLGQVWKRDSSLRRNKTLIGFGNPVHGLVGKHYDGM